jgi:hypothetical protein
MFKRAAKQKSPLHAHPPSERHGLFALGDRYEQGFDSSQLRAHIT